MTNSKLTRKFISVMLAFAMLLGNCLPSFASGFTDIYSIQGGQGGTTGVTQNTIYYGSYWQSAKSTSSAKEAIQWRVLLNNNYSWMPSDLKIMLLVSDKELYADQFNSSKDYGNTWGTSEIRATLNSVEKGTTKIVTRTTTGFAADAFTEAEWNAIAYKTSEENGMTTIDRLFLLTTSDAKNKDYGFANNGLASKSRVASATTFARNVKMYGNPNIANVNQDGYDCWWTRSPGILTSIYPAYANGAINDSSTVTEDDYAVRPAFVLNQESVLFLSAATGGKGKVSVGSGFALADYSGSSGWKLTMKDTTIATPTISTFTLDATGTSTLGYSGATTGDNKYVSAVLKNSSDKYVDYAKLASTASESDSSGTGKIGKGTVADGTYDMYIYGEEANGDKFTDYAGNFTSPFSITFKNGVITGLTLGKEYTDASHAVTLANGFALTLDKATYYQTFTINPGDYNNLIADAYGTTIAGNVTVNAGSNAVLENPFILTGAVDVAGSTYVYGNTVVSGAMNLTGYIGVIESTTISGGINSSGNASGGINVEGKLNLTGAEADNIASIGVGISGMVTINKANAENTVTLGSVLCQIISDAAGTLNITQGTVSITGDVQVPKIENNATLKFNGTSNVLGNITGTGTTEIAEGKTLTTRNAITQNSITNNGNLIFSNGYAITQNTDITGTGTTKITAGKKVTNNSTIANNVVNDGTLINAGTIGGTGATYTVTNNGTLTSTEGKVQAAVVNNGTFNKAGFIYGAITADSGKTGTLNLTGATIVGAAVSNQKITASDIIHANRPDVSNLDETDTLTLKGTATLNTRTVLDTTQELVNNITVGSLTAETGSVWNLDMVYKNTTLTADKITASTITSGSTLKLGSIRFDNNTDEWATDTTKEATIINDGEATNLTIEGTTFATNGVRYTVEQKTSGSTKYGVLNVTRAGYTGTLADIVRNNTESGTGFELGNINSYYLDKDMEGTAGDDATNGIGTLTRVNVATSPRNFTIYGNNCTITPSAENTKGIGIKTANTGDSVELVNLTMKNFGNALTIAEGTSALLNGVTFSGGTKDANIVNDGTLTFYETGSTLDKGIAGAGTTEITGDTTVTVAGSVTQGAVAIENGSTLNLNSSLSASGVTNAGVLNLNGAGTSALDTLDGYGTTNITNSGAVVTVSGTVTQDKITNSGTLNISGSSVTATGGLTNNVTLNFTGASTTVSGELTGTGTTTVANSAKVTVTSGGISQKQVTNNGTLEVTGSSVSTSDGLENNNKLIFTGTSTKVTGNITGDNGTIEINSDDTVTMTGTVSQSKITNAGTLTISGATLTTTSADGLANSGIVNFAGTTTVSGNITGSTGSTLVIYADKTATLNGIVRQQKIKNNGTLYLNGSETTIGVLYSADSTSGTTTIANSAKVTVTSGGISQKQVINNGTLEVTGSSVTTTDGLANNGTLTFSGTTEATVSGAITGTGTTEIVSGKVVTFSDAVAQKQITNEGTLNISSTISATDGVTNAGVLNINGAGTSAIGTLDGGGTTNIAGDAVVTVNGTASQEQITNEGTLNISSTLTATSGVTNAGVLTINGAGTSAIGTLDGGGTTSITNSGAVVTVSGSVEQDKITNKGTLNINGGTSSIGTLDGDGTTTVANGAVVTLYGTVTQKQITNEGTFNISGNSLSTTSGLTNNATLNFTGTSVTVSGDITGTGSLMIGDGNTASSVNTSGVISQTEITLASSDDKLTIGAGSLQANVTNNGGVVLNAGTLGDSYTITGGKITTGGDVSANVESLQSTDGIANEYELTLTGEGKIADNITGAGTTKIDGTITNAKAIDNKVTVNASADFTNSGTLTNTVTNEGALTNAGIISNNVTNNGTLTNTGIIGGTDTTYTVTNNGTLISTDGKVQAEVINNGTFNKAGLIYWAITADDMTGERELNLKDATIVAATVSKQNITASDIMHANRSEGSYLDSSDNLTLTSTAQLNTRTMIETAETQLNNITVGTLTANGKDDKGSGSVWNLDIVCDYDDKGAIQLTADTITATSTGTLKLGNIKYDDQTLGASWSGSNVKTVTVINGDANNLTIDGTTFATQGFKYEVTQDKTDKNKLDVTRTECNLTLAQIVRNEEVEEYQAGNINTYYLGSDITDPGDDDKGIGTLERVNSSEARNFTIDGRGYTITAKTTGHDGITTANSGDSLELVNVTMKNFGTALTVGSGTYGFLNGAAFSGTTGTQDILNNGTLVFYETSSTLDKGIAGGGRTVINADLATNAKISQKSIRINDTYTLTANADNIDVVDPVENYGTIEFTGGTIDYEINGYGTIDLQEATKIANSINNQEIVLSNTSDDFSTVTDPSYISDSNNNLTFNGGGFDFTDGKITDYTFDAIALNGDGRLKLDVDLANEKMDTISSTFGASAVYGAKLHITALTLLTDTAKAVVLVPFTKDAKLMAATVYDKEEEPLSVASHTNQYTAKYNSTTGNFVFVLAGTSETTKAIADSATILGMAWLQNTNNLQKRMGDLRSGTASNTGWARFERSNDTLNNGRNLGFSGNLLQVGYDFLVDSDKKAKSYFGLSLEHQDGSGSFKIGSSDIKSTTISAYYTKIFESGHYFDIIARYGKLDSDTKMCDTSATYAISTELDYAMNAFTLSGEYGYRAKLGKRGFYVEPQAEIIYGYLSGAKKVSSNNIPADIDSTRHFITRWGISFGQRTNKFNYYMRASYYHDFAGSTKVTYGVGNYKEDGATNWWEVALGIGWEIDDYSYFYAELLKYFKDISNSVNFNLGFRFTL